MCLSHSLNNEMGLPSACEYDITALICLAILMGVSGKAPIICLLAKQPGGEMSQQELGMHFDLKPGSLSEILSKLEVNGLIERSRNPKDRRQLTIRLTETGRENARIDQAARIRFRKQAFSALTHDEREDLAEMLDKIRVTWEELDD